ncbi:hypothetical protein ACOMHN_037409 [Nucella lapillus]
MMLELVHEHHTGGQGHQNESQTLQNLEVEFWNWRMHDDPQFSTLVGESRYNCRLDSFRPSVYPHRKTTVEHYVRRLQGIDHTGLTEEQQLDYDIFMDYLQTFLDGARWNSYFTVNAVNFLEGVSADPSRLQTVLPFKTLGHFQNYLQRLTHLPAQALKRLQLSGTAKEFYASVKTDARFLANSSTAFLDTFKDYIYNRITPKGWALYSEYLGEELGMYTDDYMLMGRYSSEIFCACRLVVDTGLHYFGWEREQAIQYMLDHTALGRGKVTTEIDCYLTWPGQATAYKIGEIQIKQLRQKATDVLGSHFQLGDFHSVVLSLHLLARLVDQWIEKVKAAHYVTSTTPRPDDVIG